MIKGIREGLDAVEKAKNFTKKREIFPPNIDNGSDKMIFRILSDVGEVDVHPIFIQEAQKKQDFKAIEYVRESGRWWDFCIAGQDVKCPHCQDRLMYDKKDTYKKLQRKFVVPVLVRPYKVNVPAKNTNPAKELKFETQVSYLMLSSPVMTNINQLLDIPEIRNVVGDHPNDYLTYCDLEIYKSGTGFSNTKVQIPFTKNTTPITTEEQALVCEFFGISEYSPKAVQEAMCQEWDKMELEALDRLSKVKVVTIEDEGEVPSHLNIDDDEVRL